MTDETPVPMTDDQRWQAVTHRDRHYDGRFVFAVRTTGVFCRPSCPSRRARRENVVFFADPPAALAAGFRACRRCRPDARGPDPRTTLTERVCETIDAGGDDGNGVPTLEALGEALVTPSDKLRRTFRAATGLSPRQYAEAKRLDRFKRALRSGEPVAQAVYGAGYGSSSRVYEKASSYLGMTPASYARGGLGASIHFTVVEIPPPGNLGLLLVAATERGLCMVSLGENAATLEAELRQDYPRAAIARDDEALAARVRAVLTLLDQDPPADGEGARALPLDIRATAFQWRVWRALLAIPRGETRTYGEIAAAIGEPSAARAVGRACGSNPVSLIIPCHRAVGAGGTLTGYRWGVDRKRTLLDRERKD